MLTAYCDDADDDDCVYTHSFNPPPPPSVWNYATELNSTTV